MLTQRKRFWAEVDLDAIRYNFNQVKSMLKPDTKICCVVKANAYGHGAVCLAKLYTELGADFFAVSNIEEALQLRQNGIQKPILILGYTPTECADLLAEHAISQSVFSPEYGRALARAAAEKGVFVNIHIKLDSGMGRIGFDCKHDASYKADVLEICNFKNLITEGIFTHFSVADGGADGAAYTKLQFERFTQAVDALEQAGASFKIRHCANSAAIVSYPNYQLDMVRAGIVLYGEKPSAEVKNCPLLKQTLRLKAVISQVKTLKAGDSVSYGCTFTAKKDMQIATIPVGYADGYWRSNGTGGAYMLVHGQIAPIVGRVCMDQLMLDVSNIQNVAAGDIVTVMGTDGDACITAEDLAERNNTIAYEILCAVGERVPRFYMEGNRVLAIKDSIMSAKLITR